MFSIIKKGIATLRSKGIKETLYWFYFGYLKVNKFFLFRRELSNYFPEVAQRDDILIKQISLQELKEIRENNPKLSEEFFCDIYEGAKTCFVGFVGGKLAHVMWVFFPREGSRFFNLEEGEAEINYIVTLPEFRGLNLYPLTINVVSHWLRENHYKKLYVVSHQQNINAIRAIRKCNFEMIGEVTHFSFWRPKWKGSL
jgi:GNAT superfamily N-acetyltransferase